MAEPCRHPGLASLMGWGSQTCRECGTVLREADDLSVGDCAICRRPVRDCLYTNWELADGSVLPVHDLCREAAL